MKTKSYKYGKWNFKAYHKTAGQGYEVGLYFDGKPLFVGNFIHQKEATQWWTQMDREMKTFMRKYWVNPTAHNTTYAKTLPKAWFGKFFSNHLHKTYYTFLDKAFYKYNYTFKKAFSKDIRQFKKLKKNFGAYARSSFSRAA